MYMETCKINLIHIVVVFITAQEYSELILGCGSVIITLFFGSIGPKFQVPCVATSAKCGDLAQFQ